MVQSRCVSPDKVAGAIFSALSGNTKSKSTFVRDFKIVKYSKHI